MLAARLAGKKAPEPLGTRHPSATPFQAFPTSDGYLVVALGFGADTLAGPQDAGRHLPLAGVPRPNETSEAALCELVRQAGLDPITTPRPAAERTTP